jgi:hypothetical protein
VLLYANTYSGALHLTFYYAFSYLQIFRGSAAEKSKVIWFPGAEHRNICRNDIVLRFKGAEHRNMGRNVDQL